jgi:hypothetical protein
LEEAQAAPHVAAEAPDSSAGGPPEGASAEPDPELTAAAEEESEPSFHEVTDDDAAESEQVEADIEASKPKPKKKKAKPKPKAALPPIEPDSMEVCEAQGCGHAIDLGLEMSWPTPTGRRCADCGPAPKGK